MNKKVVIPHWLHEGVKPLKNSYPKRPNIRVFDTETESRETGEPYLLIFYDGDKPSYLRVNKETILKCFTEYLREAGYYCTNNEKEDYNFKTPPTAWDESSKSAHWRNRDPGQPFFSVFNFMPSFSQYNNADCSAYFDIHRSSTIFCRPIINYCRIIFVITAP